MSETDGKHLIFNVFEEKCTGFFERYFVQNFVLRKKIQFQKHCQKRFPESEQFFALSPKEFRDCLKFRRFQIVQMDTLIAFQHPCRKTLDPRCFSHVTKNIEVFEFFSIWWWIFMIVTQKISECLNGRVKSRADVLLKKLWPNGRKCFAQVETFLNKMQNSYSQCTERKKNFPVKIYQKKIWTREKPLGNRRCKSFC